MAIECTRFARRTESQSGRSDWLDVKNVCVLKRFLNYSPLGFDPCDQFDTLSADALFTYYCMLFNNQ